MLDHHLLKKSKKKKNLSSIAYDALKDSIYFDQIKPGDLLSENAIAEQLSMSRTPVREALIMLSKEGLLEIKHGLGFYVKPITIKEISDLFQVRSALECVSIPTFIKNCPKSEIDRMEAAWKLLLNEFDTEEDNYFKTLADLDYEFHEAIINYSQNEFIIKAMEQIQFRVRKFQLLSIKALYNQKESINQHLRMLHLVRKGDILGLEKELREHIQRSGEYIAQNPKLIIY